MIGTMGSVESQIKVVLNYNR